MAPKLGGIENMMELCINKATYVAGLLQCHHWYLLPQSSPFQVRLLWPILSGEIGVRVGL